MMDTGYSPRNITCIPPSTSESDRGLHVLCTVVAYHSLCTQLSGGLLVRLPALTPNQLSWYTPVRIMGSSECKLGHCDQGAERSKITREIWGSWVVPGW